MKYSVIATLVLAGCSQFGKVNQGQVVRYDEARGEVTLVQDSNYMDPNKPRFDVLPAVTVRVPEKRSEMGPAPEAGQLLAIDWPNRKAIAFDEKTGSIEDIPFTILDSREKVRRDDPLVAKRHFPVVDRAGRTVTVYSPRDHRWAILSVDEQYLGLPASTWKFGDEVRYYYKDPRQAIRFMNVTRTDLNSGGK